MSRIAVLTTGLLTAAMPLASPAIAESYSAKPVTAQAAKKIIGKDIGWACGAAGCTGKTDSSRPLIICQDLAKRAGRLESFSADGTALSEDQLARCNSAVKDRTPTGLAKAS